MKLQKLQNLYTNGDNYMNCFGNGYWWIIILILIILFGFNGCGNCGCSNGCSNGCNSGCGCNNNDCGCGC